MWVEPVEYEPDVRDAVSLTVNPESYDLAAYDGETYALVVPTAGYGPARYGPGAGGTGLGAENPELELKLDECWYRAAPAGGYEDDVQTARLESKAGLGYEPTSNPDDSKPEGRGDVSKLMVPKGLGVGTKFDGYNIAAGLWLTDS